MNEVALVYHYQVVAALLFGIGLIGFLARRNMIVMFLSAEMMLQGVSLSLISWGRYHNDWGGQLLTIFVLTVAACEAALALALVMMLYRRSGTLDVAFWQEYREDNQDPHVDHELPEEPPPADAAWPKLTPAGTQPRQPADETPYRSHV